MSYEGYETAQGWNEEAFGTFSAEQGVYFEAELASIGLPSVRHLRILDVGYGNGAFLGWCRDQGAACDGLERNDRLVGRATALGYTVAQDLAGLQALPDHRYDLITAFDVLEHIDRSALVPFVRSFAGVCQRRTLLLFRFPNGDNPFALPLQNGDVTHLTFIGQSMLRQVAALAGFEVVAIRSPTRSRKGMRLGRRLLLAAGHPLRQAVGTLFRHVFMGGAPVTFSSNLLAVLRVKA